MQKLPDIYPSGLQLQTPHSPRAENYHVLRLHGLWGFEHGILETILVLSGRRSRGFRLGLLRSWKVFILIPCLCMLMICDIPLDVDKK